MQTARRYGCRHMWHCCPQPWEDIQYQDNSRGQGGVHSSCPLCSTNTFSSGNQEPLVVCLLNPLITAMMKLSPTLPGPTGRLPSSLHAFVQALHITLTNMQSPQGLGSCRSLMLRTLPVLAGVFCLFVFCSVVWLGRHLKCCFPMCLLS